MSSREMPRYKCHKEVRALKIRDLRPVEPGMIPLLMTPEEPGYDPIVLDAAYVGKHGPSIGGYYVVYDDGYKSFSPAQAFEAGYKPLASPSATKAEPPEETVEERQKRVAEAARRGFYGNAGEGKWERTGGGGEDAEPSIGDDES